MHDFCWVADPQFKLVPDSFQSTRINVLVRPGEEKSWKAVPRYARQALEDYSSDYGPYAYRQLTVVDARLAAGGGMEYPNLVVIATSPEPGLRLLEQTVIHEIGHQWFYGMLGSNEMAEAWLDEGFTSFAQTRYFEETYGPTGNLSTYSPGLLPGIDDRYYQQFTYQLAAADHLLKPVLTPAWKFNEEPIAYEATIYSLGGRIVDMLRRQLGDSCFNLVMQTYYERFRFHHPHTEDFIRVAEEVSGRDLHWFFNQWLTLTGTCDYAVGSVRREGDSVAIAIRRNGAIEMPLDVEACFADGTKQTATLAVGGHDPNRLGLGSCPLTTRFFSRSRLTKVILDPDHKLLETDRGDNYLPRWVQIRPVPELPNSEKTQVLCGPYVWYDASNGLQLGAWLLGWQQPDVGPLRGKNMWTLSSTYSTRLNDVVAGGTYSTSLSPHLRLTAKGSYAGAEQDAGTGPSAISGRCSACPRATSSSATSMTTCTR